VSYLSQKKIHSLEINSLQEKEKITEGQLELRELSETLLKCKAVHSETSAAAHKKLISNHRETEALTAAVAGLQQVMAEQDEAHKHLVVEKDDSIREVRAHMHDS
jgi:hypothetical protein